jgi:putative membrane protein
VQAFEEERMVSALVAYVHYLAMIAIAVTLTLELLYCTPSLSDARARVLARIDSGYGAAAVIVLATGVARVVWFGKGAAFYLHNPVFYLKIALFAAVGLLSIPPTLQFLRWMRELKGGASNVAADYQVARLRRHIHAELMLFVFIPLAAALMARGIGLQSGQ